jgi:CheY-like chemotaxis protein
MLLDIHLGGMSGFQLRQHLIRSGHSIPTSFMTGLDNEASHKEAVDAGCVAYPRKPIPTGKLVEALRTAV